MSWCLELSAQTCSNLSTIFYRSVAAWLPLPRTRIYLESSKSLQFRRLQTMMLASTLSRRGWWAGTETHRGQQQKEPQLISARGHSRKPWGFERKEAWTWWTHQFWLVGGLLYLALVSKTLWLEESAGKLAVFRLWWSWGTQVPLWAVFVQVAEHVFCRLVLVLGRASMARNSALNSLHLLQHIATDSTLKSARQHKWQGWFWVLHTAAPNIGWKRQFRAKKGQPRIGNCEVEASCKANMKKDRKHLLVSAQLTTI